MITMMYVPGSTAKATLNFKGRMYTYKFIMPNDQSINSLAMAISMAALKTTGRHFNRGTIPLYPVIYEMLRHNSKYTDSNKDNNKDYFRMASDLETSEKPVVVNCCNDKECDKCHGTGKYVFIKRWRVGIEQSHTLIIDIDGHDEKNMNSVRTYYSAVFECNFKIIKTTNGYWLLSDKKYPSLNAWIYDNCRVLYPALEYKGMKDYISKLEKLSVNDKNEWIKIDSEFIKKSGLYTGVGDFDLLFNYLSIKWKKSTIRISKKTPEDKIDIVNL